jgi:tubulin--tyrosine ligase-like protein 12
MTQADKDFQEWLKFHKSQLDSIGLPESLQRSLWRKLSFEDYDICKVCKIILNQDDEQVNLMANKEIEANSDVYLIDHAWTFRYQDAFQTLMNNDELVTRLEKLTEFSEKLEIPQEEKKETRSAQEVFAACLAKSEGRVLELDSLGIRTLKEFAWPESIEELSLIDNEIENPNEVAKCIVPLPKIKALWLNCNPVVDNCSNFTSIAQEMPSLEIINSKFTANASEWAFLYYAKEQGAKQLEDIEHLCLSGRGITYVKDASVFDRLTKLKRVDLTDHPEFFMCAEKIEAL